MFQADALPNRTTAFVNGRIPFASAMRSPPGTKASARHAIERGIERFENYLAFRTASCIDFIYRLTMIKFVH
jgi:hypothetical protein